MKISFVLRSVSSALESGILSQAITWKKGMEEFGHEVVLINMYQPSKCE